MINELVAIKINLKKKWEKLLFQKDYMLFKVNNGQATIFRVRSFVLLPR